MKSILYYLFIGLFMVLSSFTYSQNIEAWEFSSAPKMRHINKVAFNESRCFLVGGWESNDAISTIYYSDDTCQNWLLALDNVNAWLHDISFPNANIGYSVGTSGTILKSTDQGGSWEQIELPGNLSGRNYYATHFTNATTGIVLGGNESNDAIRTIIKTNDGGQTWSIISDNLGPMLRDVFFVNETIAYACGDNGTVLKSTDSGDTWSDLSPTGNLQNRRLNSIYFSNENVGIIVGGNPTNDSIQTIIKTTDGGANWSIVKDQVDHMLNAISKYDDDVLLAVGNYGSFLQTEDMGDNWFDYSLQANDTVHLNDIGFKNKFLGLTAGNYGKYGCFNDFTGNLATSQLNEPALVLTSSSVKFSGSTNPNGSDTEVIFEYGENNLFDQSVSVFYEAINGEDDIIIDLIVYQLNENTKYSGRIKTSNIHGTSYSNIIVFYTGLDYIPNFSFENWTENTTSILDDWGYSGSVSQITSPNNSQAALLQTNDDDIGAIFLGSPGDNGLVGGVPFNSRPDSVSIWLKYDIAENDTALVISMLKLNDESLISNNFQQVYGSSNEEFINVKFAINYLNEMQPEQLFFGIVSSNVFSGQTNPESNIAIDKIEFINSSEQLPNNNFENWTEESEFTINKWYSNQDNNDPTPIVEKNNEAFSGNLALKLSNSIGEQNMKFAHLSSYHNKYEYGPSFPVYSNAEKFFFYYQFYPENDDSLFINVEMYSNGEVIGNGYQFIVQSVNEYTLKEVQINYFNEGQADSASIYFTIAKNNHQGVPGDSYALLDNMSFDAIIQPQNISESFQLNESFSIYPNPTNNYANIDILKLKNNDQAIVKIYGINGELIYIKEISKYDNDIIIVDLQGISPQLLIVVVEINNKVYTKKIIKK
ncbi:MULTISPECIES: YCF48-related protein [unclassified Lentimicrobium]|uniref:WD40/YVTN/BNR-like repeat-containing protein n=1 Tax=unclassified Lentimicrobium TaxID=2677434 RepID=UPI001556703D|nr:MULTISPECIES: YCF48-related protein [unclassified Lentimicrobium]NPD47983.1 T9SS type A sorting domain-containing protein [Lentimicrobium sp. S6]NPD86981.1 T9SS type A sorting domain-containing protein [Lentimicrobium sp. L6]